MSLVSCMGMKNTPCVAGGNTAAPLVRDPADNVVLLNVPRLNFGQLSANQMALHTQAAAATALDSAGVTSTTFAKAHPGLSAVPSLRVMHSAHGTAVVSNGAIAPAAPTFGGRVMAVTNATFAGHSDTTGRLGVGAPGSLSGTPSYAAVLSSPLPKN